MSTRLAARFVALFVSLVGTTVMFGACATPVPAITRAYWHPRETGSAASLRGVHAVDADTVWATGSAGTVLRTTDGGRFWTRFQLGDELEIRDVHAFDATTAYVLSVTKPASILRTTDAGESWHEVYRHPHEDAFLDSFAFLDESRVIVFGDPLDGAFVVEITEDGGRNWRTPETLPAAREGEAAFAASGTCVVAVGANHAWIGTGGMSSRVLRTSDGGKNWEAVPSSVISGLATTGIYSVAFRDTLHGVVVGGDYTAPEADFLNAAYTDDGGTTWTSVPAGVQPRGQRAAVAWVPGQEDTLITVGRTGTDFSVDGGRTWAALNDEGYYALSFAPSGAGWAVGAEGRAARLEYAEPVSE